MTKLSILVTILSFGLNSMAQSVAQSVAQKGHECSGMIAVPSVTCLNPDGDSDDVRLYVTEFQDCKDGSITNVDRTLTALVDVKRADGSDDVYTTSSDDLLKVNFSSVRTHFDDRGDDLSTNLPVSASIKDGEMTFQMNMTTETELDYENAPADSWHYKASFKKLDASGKEVSHGRLICMIANG